MTSFRLCVSLILLWRVNEWDSSKQLSKDLKTMIILHHGLRGGYKKQSQRFELSVSTISGDGRPQAQLLLNPALARQEKYRSGIWGGLWVWLQITHRSPSKTCKNIWLQMVNHSTIQCHLHKEHLYGRVMRKKHILVKQSKQKTKNRLAWRKNKKNTAFQEKTPATGCQIWWRFDYA